MNITLNKNSWHYKIYSKIVDDTPPKSLCPYFWTLVAILIFLPLILVVMGYVWVGKRINNIKNSVSPRKDVPAMSIEDINKKIEKDEEKRKKKLEIHKKFLKIFQLFIQWILLPFLGGFLIWVFYSIIQKDGILVSLIPILIVMVFVILVFGITLFLDKYGERIGGGLSKFFNLINPFKWSITQIIGGMIYATYKKVCPIINWETDDVELIPQKNDTNN